MPNYTVGKRATLRRCSDDPAAHNVDWLQSLKQFFINVSYHIHVASLTLMALFKTELLCFKIELQVYDMTHW